ncbi:MAG: group 1 truncated hemoglobin [Acidobacteriia bacterium]|nr:group 1 truncated hemoglobin [Terriglobia bacterium]
MGNQETGVHRTDSLYAQMGGRTRITAAAERFYEKIMADGDLKTFFAGTNTTWMKMRLSRYLTQVLGGPAQYRGLSMKAAHAHLHIERRHFQQAEKLLAAALDEVGVPPNVVASVMQKVMELEPDVVTEAQCAR